MAENQPNGKGFYLEPTIVDDVAPSMTVFREEIFGPFLVVLKFASKDEALKLDIDTDYGLGVAPFTKYVTRAICTAEALQLGMVWMISCNNTDFRVPFGGYRQSGIGRELGSAALDTYSQMRRCI